MFCVKLCYVYFALGLTDVNNWCRTPIHWIHWIHGVWQRDGFGKCNLHVKNCEKLWKTVKIRCFFSHWGRSPFQPCWRPLRAWLDFVTFLLQHFPLLQRNDLLQLVQAFKQRQLQDLPRFQCWLQWKFPSNLILKGFWAYLALWTNSSRLMTGFWTVTHVVHNVNENTWQLPWPFPGRGPVNLWKQWWTQIGQNATVKQWKQWNCANRRSGINRYQ